jgi:hypothetical protein
LTARRLLPWPITPVVPVTAISAAVRPVPGGPPDAPTGTSPVISGTFRHIGRASFLAFAVRRRAAAIILPEISP